MTEPLYSCACNDGPHPAKDYHDIGLIDSMLYCCWCKTAAVPLSGWYRPDEWPESVPIPLHSEETEKTKTIWGEF